MQAVINVAIAPLTTNPTLWAQNPQQSRLVDELLLGMPVEITGRSRTAHGTGTHLLRLYRLGSTGCFADWPQGGRMGWFSRRWWL